MTQQAAPASPAPINFGTYQIMPNMSTEQFAELKEDIRRNGVLVPIEFDSEGHIIDGHHRYRAFNELVLNEGVELPMFDRIVRTFPNEEEKLRYVLALNIKRRHLTPEQRSEIVARLRKPPFSYTLQKIADTLGVGLTTVWKDLDNLDDATKAELRSLTSKGADGRTYSTSYAPRIYQAGDATLRNRQMQAIREIGYRLQQQAQPTNGASPATPSVISGNGVTESGQASAHALDSDPDSSDRVVITATPPPVPVPVIQPTISDEEAAARMTAFSWYGGKTSHLTWLLPLLPPCRHFVDVFGGSAAVLLNRDPSPIETYNDLDNSVVNFFRVLREQPEELVRLLVLTPYSRQERRDCFESIVAQDPAKANLTPIEWARRFFVMARQSRSGTAQRVNNFNSWKFNRDAINRGMNANISAWQGGIDGLATVATRLRQVQIENYSWERVLELYDAPDTLFYCDPPYAHESRREGDEKMYKYEMTDADHTRLAGALHKVKGYVALSGYPSTLYDRLYADWHHIAMPSHAFAGHGSGSDAERDRMEILWTNYPLH